MNPVRIALKIRCLASDSGRCLDGHHGGTPSAGLCERCNVRRVSEPGDAVDWGEGVRVCMMDPRYRGAAWLLLADNKIATVKVEADAGIYVPAEVFRRAEAMAAVYDDPQDIDPAPEASQTPTEIFALPQAATASPVERGGRLMAELRKRHAQAVSKAMASRGIVPLTSAPKP